MCIDAQLNGGHSLTYELTGGGVSNLVNVEAASIVNEFGHGIEDGGVKAGHVVGGQLEGVVFIKAVNGCMERPVTIAQVSSQRGAYAKKESGCVFFSRTPTMGTLYLSVKYWGSIS